MEGIHRLFVYGFYGSILAVLSSWFIKNAPSTDENRMVG
jgi:hypothetical protein